MTSRATFSLQRCMFVSKRSLLVGVALYASCISAGSESRLLELKTTVWIVAVAALHRALEDLVVERHVELRLHFAVATETKLRLAYFQKSYRSDAGLLSV